jgi:hypothetical protein
LPCLACLSTLSSEFQPNIKYRLKFSQGAYSQKLFEAITF